jgi:hypothetical protein
MPTFYLDHEQGNDNHGGTSFTLLASGSDGAISSTTFSSATANFPNDNTIAPLKNICWHTNFWQNYGSYNGCRLLSLNYYVDETITGPTGINSYRYYLQEYPTSTTHFARTQASPFVTLSNSTQYTFSVYIKSAGRNKIIFQLANDTARSARFNLSSGTVEATGASATAAISNIGGGWYRLSMTATSSASASTDIFAFYLAEDSYSGLDAANVSYMGDATKGIYFTGVQIEAASSVTTYEDPPGQILSIFNGSIYAYYHIIARINSTSLTLIAISGGTALANTSGRQYFIGGRIQTFTNGLTAVRLHSCDIIRVEASPDPTSIGNATWNGSGSAPTVAIASSTNAAPIAITTSTAHGYSTGDTVFICDHATNTNANGTWEITVTGSTTFTLTGSTGNGIGGASGTSRRATNCVVRLASSPIDNIASHGNVGEGRTAWVASANVTATMSTPTKQGNVSDSIAIGAAFTTGLAAYKAFSTKNLSGYQQLSFFIQQTAGTTGFGTSFLQLRLCSDNAGVTAVNTFNIPNCGALNTWHVFTIDLATNLGNSIQSIALNVTQDLGAQTFLLSNIIACKASSSADSLNLASLIGKNTSNETWYPIQSIVGTRVLIDGRISTSPIVSTQGNFTKGYYGTTETINTFKRETIKTTPQSIASNNVHLINDGASHFTPNIVIEGGYDRTNMSSQSGITFFDGQNSFGYGLSISSRSGWGVNRLGFVRYDRVWIQNSWFCDLRNLYVISCTNHLQLPTASQFCRFENLFLNCNQIGMATDFGFNMHKFTNCYFLSNNLRGMDLGNGNNIIFNNCSWNNNGSFGITTNAGAGSNNVWNNCNFINNQNEGYRSGHGGFNETFNNCFTSGNISNGFYSFGGTMLLNNCTVLESVEFGIYGGSDGRIYSMNLDNTANNHYIYTDFGMIRPQTSIRYTNSGFAWSMSPTSDYRRDNYPLGFPIGKVAVSANSLVTVKAWMRRSSTGLTFRLRLKGGQIAGVTNDIISYMTAAADTWEQVSIGFTPTEAGVVEILAECWGGTTNTGYIDELSIIQI